jgi:hypothetical protein
MDVASKRVWQALIAYWAGLIVFFLWVGLVQFREILFSLEWGLPAAVGCWLAFVIPYFYAVGCIAYFMTEKPKKYLHARV